MEREFCPDCEAQIIHSKSCELCTCCGWSECEYISFNRKEEFDVQPGIERESNKNNIPAEKILQKADDRNHRTAYSKIAQQG